MTNMTLEQGLPPVPSPALPQIPTPGEPMEVVPGVYWLRMPLPFKLDHINLWVLSDGDKWVLVDTGIASDEIREIWLKLLSNHFPDISAIVVTHFHPDHFGLAGWLHRKSHAPVWMTHTEWLTGQMLYRDHEGDFSRAQAEFFKIHGLEAERADLLARRGNHYRRLLSPPPLAHRSLHEGDELRIGGRQWRVMVARGHAPEHVSLYCEALKLLISGDQILPRITPNIGVWSSEPLADPLGQYLASLEQFEGLASDTRVMPSHEWVFDGLHARISALREHHHERLDKLRDFCGKPRSAAESLQVLFRRALDTHQLGFAMGESIAHLHYLEVRGDVTRLEHDGMVRFVSGS